MKRLNLKGFTLVELIVVITIVGILSTVGFVSYSGYLTGARDSNRISQLTKLSDSLQVYSANKTLPLPDDAINITASGTLIGYQGEVGTDVLETIDYTNGGQDPKDNSYYSYYLTKDRNSIQLMALMEESDSLTLNNLSTQTHANFEERFPKVYGRKLGILTYNDTADISLINTPANLVSANASGLDIVGTATNYIAHISDDEKLEGPGTTIRGANPSANCKRLKQTGQGGDSGAYTISPSGTDFEVYCDMETAGGGWTMGARSSTAGGDIFSLSVNSLYSFTDYANAYSVDTSDITYTNAMLVSFTNDSVSNVFNVLQDTLSVSTMEVGSYTLNPNGITGGAASDGFNGEQGAIFLK